MKNQLRAFTQKMDWVMILSIVPIVLAGLSTMTSFGASASFFNRQLFWIGVSILITILIARSDLRFFRDSRYIVLIYSISMALLVLVLLVGRTVKGAQSWFNFGSFSFQPTDIAKLAVIAVLAKYFSRRHIEIARIKHLFISAIYVLIPIGLIMLQPDFGSALIIAALWFGMALVSGISKRHILFVTIGAIVVFLLAWFAFFKPYQKARIITFINPTSDIRGSGYNAYQSVIAVGSGQLLGKGFGYGTQSRLNYLPEHKTDFIFAAFAEEWGLVGSVIVIASFCLLLWRIILHARLGATNFETLFCVGYVIYLFSHIIINIGMNIGIMPVTGIPLPFMSYGGSHLLGEGIGLGVILSMIKYERASHRDDISNEFSGFTHELK